MNKEEIKLFLDGFKEKKERIIIIVDFSNVEKWKESLGWIVDIKKLGNLIKHFSQGKRFLRRFYYGSDFGKSEKSDILAPWSNTILKKAKWNGFEVITKRVKYIHCEGGYNKKCDLDVEMAVDLIKEIDNYDTIIIFSGDGDLMTAICYLSENFDKKCFVFGARNHIGREVFDAKNNNCVEEVLFVEDFEYRLR